MNAGPSRILAVKNWRKFQHYKDRCPPWIKVHVRILTDRKFMELPLHLRGLLMGLWVLASENEGQVNEEDLPFRLHLQADASTQHLEDMINTLTDSGFLILCKQSLANDTPSVSPSVSLSVSELGGPGESKSPEEVYTLQQCLSAADGLHITPEQVRAFFTHYAPVGFIDGAKRKIINLKYALQKWAADDSSRPKGRARISSGAREQMGRSEAVTHAVDRLAPTSKTFGRNSEEFRRAMSVLGTEYGKYGVNNQKQTVVAEAIEILNFRESTERETPSCPK